MIAAPMPPAHQTIAHAVPTLLRVWDTLPLFGHVGPTPGAVEGLAGAHGLRLRRVPMARIRACQFPLTDELRILSIDATRCATSQDFLALAEITAWMDGTTIVADSHRVVAAIGLLPALGASLLQAHLDDLDPEWARTELPGLIRMAAHALHLAERHRDGRACLERGVQARGVGRYDVAMAWYRRAERAGSRDAQVKLSAWLGTANALLAKGDIGGGKAVLLRGVSLCRAHAQQELEGKFSHDLLAVAIAESDWIAAEGWAARAVEAYGPGHRNAPQLAHDTAAMWAGQGFNLRALPVFEAVLTSPAEPFLRLAAAGNAARSSASVGAGERYLAHAASVKELLTAGPPLIAGQALLALAEGAAALGLHDQALRLIAECAASIVGRGESATEGEVDALARRLADKEASAAACDATAADAKADHLAHVLVESVRAVAA